jgi:hypothetical protein
MWLRDSLHRFAERGCMRNACNESAQLPDEILVTPNDSLHAFPLRLTVPPG